MSRADFESRFRAAKLRLREAAAVRWQQGAAAQDESSSISMHQGVIAAKRAVAADKGEPYAVPLEFPVEWDPNGPCPRLLRTESTTFLMFCLQAGERDRPSATLDDGTADSIDHLYSLDDLGLVGFHRCSMRCVTPRSK